MRRWCRKSYQEYSGGGVKMILFEGKLYEDSEADNIFEKLWDSCVRTIESRGDISGLVIDACNRLAENIKVNMIP